MRKDKAALPYAEWVAKLATLSINSRLALAAGAALLVTGVLLASCGLQGQSPGSPGPKPQSAMPSVASQKQGGVTVYSVTPQGGPPPAVTPEVNPGGPMILTPPLPAFYLGGDVYRNNDAYRADTGLPVRSYLKELGDVEIYQPKLVGD